MIAVVAPAKTATDSISLKDAGLTELELTASASVRTLDVSSNAITSLAPLGALPALQHLTARCTSLTRVLDYSPAPFRDNHHPYEFSVMPRSRSSLEVADLGENEGITEINDLSGHPDLTELRLDHCGISVISGLSSLSRLRVLDLSGQFISAISGLEGLPLLSLNLSSNKLTALENLATLTELQSLDVSSNSISSLTGLESCTSIVTLDISGNAIEHVAEVENLYPCTLLGRLTLEGNPVTAGDHYRLRILFRLRHLTNLDGEPVSAESVAEALNLHGADVSSRTATFEEYLPEETFENLIPPLADDRK